MREVVDRPAIRLADIARSAQSKTRHGIDRVARFPGYSPAPLRVQVSMFNAFEL